MTSKAFVFSRFLKNTFYLSIWYMPDKMHLTEVFCIQISDLNDCFELFLILISHKKM